jgi:outer membrane protein insertion porin family/translocation and assembly module TamA
MERPEVAKLSIKGVKAVEVDELQNSIATTASHCRSILYRFLGICAITKSRIVYQHEYLDHAELQRDVLRIKVFYFKRGYRDTEVDTSVSRVGPGRVAVAFRITEGPPTLVEKVTVSRPDGFIDDKQVSRLMRLRGGSTLDLFRLDSSVVRLQQAFWDRGYADAVVDTNLTVDEARRTATLSITIDPKWKTKVGPIVIRRDAGSSRQVSDRTIFNSLSLHTGDLYVRDRVLRSQRTLYESNLFTRATFVIPPQGDSIKTIDVSVREAPLHEVRTSAGFNTVDYAQVDGRYTHYNFLGGAKRLDLRAGAGNLLAPALTQTHLFRDVRKTIGAFSDPDPFLKPTWQASADLTQPWVRGPRNSLGVGVFTHRRITPGVVVDRGVGASASFTREVALRAPASLGYRFEVTRVEAGDVYFCVNFGVCDSLNIRALRGRQRLSPLGLTAQIDRTDDPFSPASGMRGQLDVEHASSFTASDFRYNRAFAQASTYRRVRHKGVLAFRGRIGWVNALRSTDEATGVNGPFNNLIHPRKRFYAGGSQSVRGFGENQLGPRVLTIPHEDLAKFCDMSSSGVAIQCDPNKKVLNAKGDSVLAWTDRDFTPRPLGGNTLIEGSAEYRFPIWQQLGGAVFVDGGVVGQGTLKTASTGFGAITPGFGFRYYSPVGPIRVDMGFNPFISEDLVVVTDEPLPNGQRQLVQLTTKRTYAPARTEGGLRGLANRVTLHLSIGQAF